MPALTDLAREFDIDNTKRAQLVITSFLLAFGAGHLLQGFLTDRLGRKPVLLANLLLYSAAAAICATTGSFGALLVAPAVQGFAAAGCRVAATAVLRDVWQGDELARLMSLANCGVLAIQPHGAIASVAPAMVGGMISHMIGQSYAGTIGPLAYVLPGAAMLALLIERLTNTRRVQKSAVVG